MVSDLTMSGMAVISTMAGQLAAAMRRKKRGQRKQRGLTP
jgi:hypothetical protein